MEMNHKMQIFSRVVNFFGDSGFRIVQMINGGAAFQAALKGEFSK
jgi:hypothetical protein